MVGYWKFQLLFTGGDGKKDKKEDGEESKMEMDKETK